MNIPKIDTRMLLIVGLIVIVGILFVIPRLNQTTNQTPATSIPIIPTARPVDNSGTTNNSSIRLGELVTAPNVDRDGCPVNPTSTFQSNAKIYVVAQGSYIPAGTTIFVRLYQNNQPVEDAPEITADQDYNDSCVNFVFEPRNGVPFKTGQYEAEFIVNGNASDAIQFQIR